MDVGEMGEGEHGHKETFLLLLARTLNGAASLANGPSNEAGRASPDARRED
jgi:hypothetical protein